MYTTPPCPNFREKAPELTAAGALSSNRAPMLDVLRILLCVGVTFYHYTPIRPASGSFSVLGFLVMSGFLLGIHFDKIAELNVVRFYQSKIKRFMPMFLIALLFGIVYMASRSWKDTGEIVLLEGMTTALWGNFDLVRFVSRFNSPLWFMVVEFCMLLAAPFFFVLYKRRFIIVFLVACTLVSWFLYQQIPYASNRGSGLYYSPLARCWQFIAGMTAAWLYCRICTVKRGKIAAITGEIIHWVLFACFCSFAAYLMLHKQQEYLKFWNFTFDFDMICVFMYSSLIPLMYSRRYFMPESIKKCLTRLSELTYPVYLLHVPLMGVSSFLLSLISDNINFCYVAWVSVVMTLVCSDILLRLQKRWIG